MTLDDSVLALWVHVHATQLALEPLPRVALHDLGADVARGDVLVAVPGQEIIILLSRYPVSIGALLRELVAGLQHGGHGGGSGGRGLARGARCRCVALLTALHVLEGVHPLALDLAGHLGAARDGTLTRHRTQHIFFSGWK